MHIRIRMSVVEKSMYINYYKDNSIAPSHTDGSSGNQIVY
jgi:hypothetical protein